MFKSDIRVCSLMFIIWVCLKMFGNETFKVMIHHDFPGYLKVAMKAGYTRMIQGSCFLDIGLFDGFYPGFPW
jgi:hypothetical protein